VEQAESDSNSVSSAAFLKTGLQKGRFGVAGVTGSQAFWRKHPHSGEMSRA